MTEDEIAFLKSEQARAEQRKIADNAIPIMFALVDELAREGSMPAAEAVHKATVQAVRNKVKAKNPA